MDNRGAGRELDSELRSLVAESRMDEILFRVGRGDEVISAGDITLQFPAEDETGGSA